MARSRSRSIAALLVISFLAVGLIPAGIIAIISYGDGAQAIEEQVLAQLTSMRDAKRDMVQRYLQDRVAHASALSNTPSVQDGLPAFQSALEMGGIGSFLWNGLEAEIGGYLNNFVEDYGYRGLYLIAEDGLVLYNTTKEEDMGTNLLDGVYSNTHLADGLRRAQERGTTVVTDMSLYPPAGNVPLMFIVHPVKDGTDMVLGYMALALAPDDLQSIMGLRSGLGETGETFLVGPDMTPRTSLHLMEGESLLRSRVDTEAVRRALAGETGAGTSLDYRNRPVLAAFAPLDFGDLGWVLVAQMDAGEALAASRSLLQKSVVLAAGMAVVVVFMAVFMGRSISRPVQQIAAAAVRMADGDLTLEKLEIDRRDEVGEMASAFNQMVANWREIMRDIQQTGVELADRARHLSGVAEQSSSATNQISSAIEQVASGANLQASSANETVGSMDQLRRSIDQIASGARKQAQQVQVMSELALQMVESLREVSASARVVAEGATKDLESARAGGQAVRETVEGMGRIRTTVNEVADRVRELGQQSQRIGEIVQLISDIAEQTNLLALNAAIEAARAGEHGRGFAVVAEEVRKLAERSAQSSSQVAQLVESIQAGVKVVVEAVQTGTQEVEDGAVLAGRAGEALEQIVQGIQQSNQRAQEIAAAAEQVTNSSAEIARVVEEVAAIAGENARASEEMSSSSHKVSEAVEHISTVSSETAAAAEEVAASAEEVKTAAQDVTGAAATLTDMADRLAQLVGRFRI
ncbi:MAG: methyl-accepting chemotaxis protein [Firmicutes bacterium]|nr:methyl-accepting chemotaxis protein [Bacillota bacterium]